MATTNTNKLRVSELDFDTIRDSLKNFLRSYSKDGVAFTDYDFESSGLAILLDQLAYNTHYNAFYLNMIANELFLDTATIRNSVVSNAKQLGYVPRSVRSAKSQVSITFEAPDLVDEYAGTLVSIPRGTSFISVIGNKSYSFVTTKTYTAEPIADDSTSYAASDIIITEGIYASIQYAYNSQINQKFIIPNKNVDTTTLFVVVTDAISGTSGTIYTRAEDYAALKSDSKVFFLQETDNELYEIYFGDNNIGASPQDGNIIDIAYVLSNGEEVNGASLFTVDPIVSPITPGTTYTPTVTVSVPAYGGAPRETLSSIKFLAPRTYEAQNRAVTCEDYKARILVDFPEADAVACWGGEDNDPPDYGKVYISIKPISGYVLSDVAKRDIKTNILKTRNVLTVEPILVDPDYLFLVLDCIVKWDPRLTALTSAALRNGIIQEIVDFGQNNLENFEKYFRYSFLSRTIDAYDDGVLNNLLDVKIRKEIVPTLNIPTQYYMNFSNPILLPHDDHAGSITSSTFTYRGYTECRLADYRSRIRIVGTSSSGANVIIDDDAGVVDYNQGKIVLKQFSPSSFKGDAMRIDIIPKSRDVVPSRNQLITIRSKDISLSMVDDTSIIEGTLFNTKIGN